MYCTAETPKAPVIFTAHVFEEVEIFQLNVKQDLLGFSAGLRHFIADSVSEQTVTHAESHIAESPNRLKAFQRSIIIDVLGVH